MLTGRLVGTLQCLYWHCNRCVRLCERFFTSLCTFFYFFVYVFCNSLWTFFYIFVYIYFTSLWTFFFTSLCAYFISHYVFYVMCLFVSLSLFFLHLCVRILHYTTFSTWYVLLILSSYLFPRYIFYFFLHLCAGTFFYINLNLILYRCTIYMYMNIYIASA